MKTRQKVIDEIISEDFLKTIDNIELPGSYNKLLPTLLVVDDYSSIIKLFKKLFKRTNLNDHFNIIYSYGRNVGLEVVKELYDNDEFNIDIVIADITYGSNFIDSDNTNHGFDGVILTNILKNINPNLIYLFITGHILTKETAVDIYNSYTKIANDNILDHVVYKEIPISTNIQLLKDLLKGSRYEKML